MLDLKYLFRSDGTISLPPQIINVGEFDYAGLEIPIPYNETVLSSTVFKTLAAGTSEQSRAMLREFRENVLEKVLKLPEGIKWLPDLYLRSLEGFGKLPNGNILSIHAHPLAGIIVHFGAPDAQSWQNREPGKKNLPISYEEMAGSRIDEMVQENQKLQQSGKPSLPATEDLNKVRQELDL